MDSHGKTHQKEQDDVGSPNPVTLSKYSNRVELKTLVERSDGGARLAGKRVVVGGWIKSSRAVKKDSPPPPPVVVVSPPSSGGNQASTTSNISCTEIIQSKMNIFRKLFDVLSGGGKTYPIFDKSELAGQKAAPPPEYILYFLISDGSSISSLQVVVDSAMSNVPVTQLMALGTCIVAEGVLRQPLAASAKHVIELEAEKLLHVGTVDPEKYPLSKKQLPLHMLRDFSHFRPRTTTVGSVTRVHSALTLASHTFLQYHGFQHVQVPVITTTGVGEMFRVTTLLGETDDKEEKKHANEKHGFSIDTVKAAIKEKTRLIDHLKRSDSNREAVAAAVHDLKKTSDLASQLEMKQKPKAADLIKPEKFDFSKDFFGCDTYLTVSGRFHLESYASALGKVYSFGPRFMADKIDNARHLAEMWNVEAEMAAITHVALRSPVHLPPSSAINPRFHGINKRPPARLFFPAKPFPSLSIRSPNSIRLTASSASPSTRISVTPLNPAAKSTAPSSTLTGSTRSLATLAALTIAVAQKLSVAVKASSPGIGEALRFSLRTAGPVFLASLRERPPGYLNTPLTVVAVGIKKWLDIYSGVLMVRVLLSWFPNIPWERQPLSAIRDLCDPYLNLFRNIIPPIFDTLDVSPLLAFAVLGTLGSIVHGSTG